MDPYDPEQDNSLSRLLERAGRQQPPAPERVARARAAAHAHWRRHLDRRRRQLWSRAIVGSAIAASLVGLAAWSWPWPPSSSSSSPTMATATARAEVATLLRTVGVARVIDIADGADDAGGARFPAGAEGGADGGRASSAAIAGARLRAGAAVETAGDGRAALALAHGISLRLDHDTRIVFDAVNRVRLERGAVYVDSGARPKDAGAGGDEGLRVETRLGTVRHIGTQFEVRLDVVGLRTRVREGVITVQPAGGGADNAAHAGAGAASAAGVRADVAGAETSNVTRTDAGPRWTSRAGEALFLAPGREPVVRRTVTSGAEWDWVTTVAPPFRLEGSTLPAFLDWVSREQGWRWAFVDDSTRQRAARIVLHGSTDGMRPVETIAPVLAASGMSVTRDGDRLLVSFAR